MVPLAKSQPHTSIRIPVVEKHRISKSLLKSIPSRSENVIFIGDETAPFFGFLDAAAALVFSCMGAAYGTAKSGVGVASMGVMRPELVMKSIVPMVMASVLGIYGLIIAVIINTGINPKAKSCYLFDGYGHLSSGLSCGLAGLAAGMAIGIVGDAGVRVNCDLTGSGLVCLPIGLSFSLPTLKNQSSLSG
ncbi:V-type proton ATPase 16 kDa proteolipid subunit-like isoform X2 [Primulina huaijiensis]|uniref:V-type proton ATPase 16 kDa proteolipid subunit-like isoform X2 n=1 Tax=Primulina huaijiensis TaxID=1492673 RepID=UPI003CC77612